MEFFWIFTTACLLVMLLLLAMRGNKVSWSWNFLIIAVIMFTSLFKMTGTPRDAWLFATIEHVHGDMEVVSQVVIPNKFIYLLLRKTPGEAPYYLRLPWSGAMEQEMNSAMMLAQEQQTKLLVDVDKLSSWSAQGTPSKGNGNGKLGESQGQGQGDKRGAANNPQGKEGGEHMFHPKPVQPDPLKTPAHTQIEIH